MVCGGMEWFEMAQVRFEWWTFIIRVKKCRGLQLFKLFTVYLSHSEAWGGVVVKVLRYLSDGPRIDSR
jgi:hypothetical protein